MAGNEQARRDASISSANDMPSSISALLGMLAIMHGIFVLVAVIMVIRRRHLQPLKFRDPIMLIAGTVTLFISGVAVSMWSDDCLVQWMTEIPLMAQFVLIGARFWKLLLASFLTQARVSENTKFWVFKYPWLISSRNIWRSILTLIAIVCLAQAAVLFPSPGCIYSDNILYFMSTVFSLYWLAIAIMTWKMRKIRDGFFVANELRMLGCVILIENVVVLYSFGSINISLSTLFTITVGNICQNIIQLGYPLWKSYQMVQTIEANTTNAPTIETTETTDFNTVRPSIISFNDRLTSNSKFRDLLRHPDGFNAMKQFLILEFSVENLLCWQKLNANKKEYRPDQVDAHFRDIYYGFVRTGSPNEINVNSELKSCFRDVFNGKPIATGILLKMKPLKMQLSGAGPGPETETKLRLLKQLYHEVTKLMEQDPYQRFKQTKEYFDLIQETSPNMISIRS